MSNVVTSQPILEAKINNLTEPPPSEINNCEKCRKDDQCCFVYFYSLYCSQCRCSGYCDDEKQKRRRPQRRDVKNYYTNDTVFKDDLYVTRGFLDDENDYIHTYNDYGPSEVTNEYDKATNNSVGHAEVERHLDDNIDVGGVSGEVCADGDLSGKSEGAGHSHVNNGGRDHTISVGVFPTGTANGGYSGGHSESGIHPSGNDRGGEHCVSGGHSEGHTGSGDNSGGHSVSVDDSSGNSGGGDTGGDCGGDTGGDCGGGGVD